MACEDCDKETDSLERLGFFRWGTANIAIVACPQHMREVMDVLRNYQRYQEQRQAERMPNPA